MPNKVDLQHKELIRKILEIGVDKRDRTGVGTKSVFGHQLVYDMEEGYPLLTLRKIHTKSLIHEMLWFLGSYDEEFKQFGNTNIRYLLQNGITFWSEWPYKKYTSLREYRPELPELTMKEFEAKIIVDDAFAKEFGSIGPGYGKQWLNYGGKTERITEEVGQKIIVTQGINQIDYLIEELKKDPDSRRLILDAWKVDEIEDMLLPPCHMMFQLYSEKIKTENLYNEFTRWIHENKLEFKPIDNYPDFPTRKLSMMLYIRSQDLGLGNPYNVAEYALLLHMISQVVNMIPNKLIVNLGDVHIYNNHIEQMKKLLIRESYELPTLELNKSVKNIYDFRYEDIKIENYNSHSHVKMEVAV